MIQMAAPVDASGAAISRAGGSTVRSTRALPGIGAPATRALDVAGVLSLEELVHWSEDDLLALHGVGPKTIGILRDHLVDLGLDFKR